MGQGTPGSKFPTTRWSLVLAVGGPDNDEARRALSDLCDMYWRPLYALARREAHAREKAEDLVQGFFTALLRRNEFARLCPEKGRLRGYLRTAFHHYVLDEKDRERAGNRIPDNAKVPLDLNFEAAERAYLATKGPQADAEDLYDLQWAQGVVDLALSRLRERCRADGRLDDYDRLLRVVVGDLSDQTYTEAAGQLGLGVSALKMRVLRFKKQFGEELKELVADTVAEESEIEQEVRFLLSVLRRV